MVPAITSPLDLQLVINEKLEMIDWDVHAKSLAKPLGNFLTVCFFAMRLLQDNLIKPNYYKLNVKSDAFDLSKSNKLKEFDYLLKYPLISKMITIRCLPILVFCYFKVYG